MALDRKRRQVCSRHFSCLTLAAICLLLVPSRYAFGQVDEGSITGTFRYQRARLFPTASDPLEHGPGYDPAN